MQINNNYYKGQSLHEYALIAGIVVLGVIASLGNISSQFIAASSQAANTLTGKTGSGSQQEFQQQGGSTNNLFTPGLTFNGTTAEPTSFESQLSQEEQSILLTAAQHSQEKLEAIKGGMLPYEEMMAWGEEKAKTTLSKMQALQSVMTSLAASHPDLKEAIDELMRSGKLLAGYQMSIAQDAIWEKNHSITNEWGGPLADASDFSMHLESANFIHAIAKEIGQPINGLSGDGTWDAETDISGTGLIASVADTEAKKFETSYNAILSKAASLDWSAAEQHTFESAASRVLANAGLYTFSNAKSTYSNTEKAGQEGYQALQ